MLRFLLGLLLKPLRLSIEGVGRGLARLGLIDEGRAAQVAGLAWPRIATGLARMSKSTADVAMVGAALGTSAIAGVGFALPFWMLAFILGGGIAGGTISLVSQAFAAGRSEAVSTAVKVSAAFGVMVVLPLALLFGAMPETFVDLIGSGEEAVAYGARYLRIVSVGMPFAVLSLVASRTLVGAGDAWSPMLVRAGGAVANIGLNAVLIFGFDLGVAGAAVGTVIANVAVASVFAWGLLRGRLPLVGELPVRIDARAPWNAATARRLASISAPLALTNLAQSGGQFPLLALVGLFGPGVTAAFVVALRVRELLNTPGWGFGLASTSLVGQALGTRRGEDASRYAQDTLRFAVAVYVLAAVLVFVLATPVARLFIDDPSLLPTTALLIRATCLSVVCWGLKNGAMGPLRASGDTQWPLYGQLAGLLLFALPLAYLGAVTSLGVYGLALALVFEAAVPAAVTYYRYRSDRWHLVSRAYQMAAAR